MSEERIWLYLDQNRTQRGPFPSSVLQRLLEKGLAGISAQTLIWKHGFEEWKMMSTVPEFITLCQFHNTQWYYVTNEQETKGPVATRFLLHKMKEGALALTNLVYRKEDEGWRSIQDIPELQQEYHKVQAEREQQEQLSNMAAKEVVEEQVFNPDDVFENIPVFEKTKPVKEDQDNVKEENKDVESSEKKGKKSFVADNGLKYKWDEEEDCWVMDDSEGEDDEETLPDEEKHIDKANNKRARDNEDDVDEDETDEVDKTAEDLDNANNKPKRRRSKKKKKLPNTWVYITGLPANITVEEMKDHFSKVGLIAISPYDQQPKIKLYKDELDQCKGDGSLCYNAEESVQLALDILDGGYIRPNYKITVTKANFEYSQGNTDPAMAKLRKPTLTSAQIKVARNASKQALAWNVDENIGVSKSTALRIIVLEGMFHPHNFQEASFEKELEEDIAMECGKLGTIEKMTIFSKNPRGVVVLKYTTAAAAQECIRIMNGRYFGKMKLKCYYWDGVTNYSMTSNQVMDEEEKEEEERLHALGDWLEHDQEDLPEEFMLRTE